MKLTEDDARTRLHSHGHGVLATLHESRGPDQVPVVYAVDGDVVGVPVDRVKPKSGTRLQRERNLAADPRASLLIEHWDADDWSRLWWVRAQLQWIDGPDPTIEARLADLLADRFEQYADLPFSSILMLRVVRLSGWAAR